MALKLSKVEFDYRAQELFDYLAYGMPIHAACELAGLDQEKVKSKAQRGKELYLKGAEIGKDVEFYQAFTRAKYALQLDALENLRTISDKHVASSWQASRLLLQLNNEERQERDNGMLPGIMSYLNRSEDESEEYSPQALQA